MNRGLLAGLEDDINSPKDDVNSLRQNMEALYSRTKTQDVAMYSD